jgi:shikimate kinase/3-dehydroquinate synthase
VAAALNAVPRKAALVFIGFMGAGKSSAAREAAAELGIEAQDSDRRLEERLGATIEQFFDREGEAAFRAREQELVVELLDSADGGVIALGGGSLGSDRVRAALARHTTVLLDVDRDVAWSRAAQRGRPLARDRDAFDALYAARAAIYDGAWDAVIPSRESVRRARRRTTRCGSGPTRRSARRGRWWAGAS